jgi:hypothetical protein
MASLPVRRIVVPMAERRNRDPWRHFAEAQPTGA